MVVLFHKFALFVFALYWHFVGISHFQSTVQSMFQIHKVNLVIMVT